MIRQHNCLISFGQLRTRHISIAIVSPPRTFLRGYYLMLTIWAASRRVIFWSKPPLGNARRLRGSFGPAWRRWKARRPTRPLVLGVSTLGDLPPLDFLPYPLHTIK